MLFVGAAWPARCVRDAEVTAQLWYNIICTWEYAPVYKRSLGDSCHSNQGFAFLERLMNIKQGLKVRIVLKRDQETGKLTEGVVKDILTKSPTHHHGIKVRLSSGDIGRVKEILS